MYRAEGMTLEDTVQAQLKTLASGGTVNDAASKDLMRRKLVAKAKTLTYKLKQGPQYGVDTNYGSTLTSDMMISGEWKVSTEHGSWRQS